MNISSHLKTFTLLFILHATNIGASAPASQAAIPVSLQAELKRIEELPDHKALIEVIPYHKDKAEQYLREDEDEIDDIRGFRFSLKKASAKLRRSELKFWAIGKELTSCPDGALKQILQIKLDEADNQRNTNRQESVKCANDCIKNHPFDAYNFMVYSRNALACQASILLAQKVQWQQEKQSLIAKFKKSQEDLEQLRILHRRPIDPEAKKVTNTLDMKQFIQLACIKKTP